jgi:hypothetical protein
VSTVFSHLHIFCATGGSSVLAPNATLVGHTRSHESLLCGGGPASNLIFVPWYMVVFGLHFKWYSLCMHLLQHMSDLNMFLKYYNIPVIRDFLFSAFILILKYYVSRMLNMFEFAPSETHQRAS